MSTYGQYAIDAIAAGGLYAMLALSIALLFNVMGLINFAYGELIMAGGYAMYYLNGLPWPVVIIGTIATTVTLSVAMERLAFRPVRTADVTTLLITSFAVSVALQSLAQIIFGTQPKGLPPIPMIDGAWELGGGLQVQKLDVLTAISTGLMIAGLTLIIKRTVLGIQLRASTEDFAMARMTGVRANRVVASAFAITGVLAGVATLLFISKQGAVTPTVGFAPLLVAFVGAVIGGLGGLVPAAIGGFALGAVTTVLQGALPVETAVYTQAVTFAAVIVLMIFKPEGIGTRGQRARTV